MPAYVKCIRSAWSQFGAKTTLAKANGEIQVFEDLAAAEAEAESLRAWNRSGFCTYIAVEEWDARHLLPEAPQDA